MASENVAVRDNVLLQYLECAESIQDNARVDAQKLNLPMQKEPVTLAEVLKQAEACDRSSANITPQPDATPSALDELLLWRKSVTAQDEKSPGSPKSFANVLSPMINSDPRPEPREEHIAFADLLSLESEGSKTPASTLNSEERKSFQQKKARLYRAASSALKIVEGADAVSLPSLEGEAVLVGSGRRKIRRRKQKNGQTGGDSDLDDSDADAHSGGAFAALRKVSVTKWCGDESENVFHTGEEALPQSGKVRRRKKKGARDPPRSRSMLIELNEADPSKSKDVMSPPKGDADLELQSPKRREKIKKLSSRKLSTMVEQNPSTLADESPVAGSGSDGKKKTSAPTAIALQKGSTTLSPTSETRGVRRTSRRHKSPSPTTKAASLSAMVDQSPTSKDATPKATGKIKEKESLETVAPTAIALQKGSTTLSPTSETRGVRRTSKRHKSPSPTTTAASLSAMVDQSPTSKDTTPKATGKIKEKDSLRLSPTSMRSEKKSSKREKKGSRRSAIPE